MTDLSPVKGKQSIQIIIDGEEKRFNSMEELEQWAKSLPDGGKAILETLQEMKKPDFPKKGNRTFIRIEDEKGGEHVFNSEEEFNEWLAVHPEFKGVAEGIRTDLRESLEDDPKIKQAIDDIASRLKISEDLSEAQILEMCRALGISESGQKAVIRRLGMDSRFVSKRKGIFGFLGMGELFFFARK